MRHNKAFNLTGAAFSFRAVSSHCSGPGKLTFALARTMAHGLLIVVGDDWESQMQPHCIHREVGTEGDGQFDWCEIGGRFGKPLKLRQAQPRRGLLRFFGSKTHTTQARRSEIELEALQILFPFDILADGRWCEPESFEEAKQLLNNVAGDPLLTGVDYHL